MCALAIYLITVLSYPYGIIMDCANKAPGHVNNVVDWLNATDKLYLKRGMGLIGKLGINDAKTFVMLPILQKTPPLHLHINIYTFSKTSKDCMNLIVAQKVITCVINNFCWILMIWYFFTFIVDIYIGDSN